jgi:NAD(P)-dependent dehydrogenase (short-subunit alcohol dehydrogenase family)
MGSRLEGKVALITGGSRGIGRAICEIFAAEGAHVMIASRKEEDLKQAASEIQGDVAWTVANAGDPEAAESCVAATVGRFGGLDILVNNAATNPYIGELMGLDVSRADKTVQVNLRGALVWTQCAWRAAMSERGGNVINVSSAGGLSVATYLGYYNITKAAIIHLTKQLAFELGPKGVRVNAIAPGLVKTDMARQLWETYGETFAAKLPLRRLGEPSDIAEAALFLASDASSWITGHTLVVDGGSLVNSLE